MSSRSVIIPLVLHDTEETFFDSMDTRPHRRDVSAVHSMGFALGYQCRAISLPCTSYCYAHHFFRITGLGLAFTTLPYERK